MARIRLICFDLGGVIVRGRRSWEDAREAAGLPPRGSISSSDLLARFRPCDRLFELGQISTDDFFDRCSREIDRLYTPDELRRIHEAWIDGEYPGMDRLVKELRPRFRTACLSNTNPKHWEMMETAPPPPEYRAFRALDTRQASHLLGLAKPAPEIFREFERRTESIPGEILFFDDLEVNVRAAREAGWNARQVDSLGDPRMQILAFLRAGGLLDAVSGQ